MVDPRQLFPEDVALVWTDPRLPVDLPATTVDVRFKGVRREHYFRGRECARLALGQLGISIDHLRAHPDGAPDWPAGIVGSITHCRSFVGAVAARAEAYDGIGLDAEELDRSAPAAIRRIVCTPAEHERFALLPAGTDWEMLAFSAKEAIYKALPAECRRAVGFKDVEVAPDVATQTFRAVPVGDVGECAERLERMSGRYLTRSGIILTGIVIPAA